MQGIFDKVSKTVVAAANKTGNKANELIEVGKLKSKLSSEKQEISNTMKEIGEYCYGLYGQGNIEDDKIKEMCERIAACNAHITDLEQQIRMAKAEYEAGSGRDSAEE